MIDSLRVPHSVSTYRLDLDPWCWTVWFYPVFLPHREHSPKHTITINSFSGIDHKRFRSAVHQKFGIRSAENVSLTLS